MSIIITGIEKYKDCYSCPYNQYDCYCQITGGGIDRDDWYCDKPCPIKTVDGLVDEIEHKAKSGPYKFAVVFGMKKAIELIKEYCGVADE